MLYLDSVEVHDGHAVVEAIEFDNNAIPLDISVIVTSKGAITGGAWYQGDDTPTTLDFEKCEVVVRLIPNAPEDALVTKIVDRITHMPRLFGWLLNTLGLGSHEYDLEELYEHAS